MISVDMLERGKIGENWISLYLKNHGRSIIPVYEKAYDPAVTKGPRVYTPDAVLIAPDMLVYSSKEHRLSWVEVKSKSGWTWHRKTQTFQTGINRYHFTDYCKYEEHFPNIPFWIVFLQLGEATKDCPVELTPSGLYGQEILILKQCVDHTYKHMVYWKESDLKKIAELNEVYSLFGPQGDVRT